MDLQPYSSPHSLSNLEHWSSVGHRSRLPQGRPGNSSVNTASLIIVYSNPNKQYHGDRSTRECPTFTHRIYISKCLSLKLAEDKAWDHLYCVFASYRKACHFYYKHVQSKASALNKALYFLYNRFMSEDRREMLTKLWKNMKLDQFRY